MGKTDLEQGIMKRKKRNDPGLSAIQCNSQRKIRKASSYKGLSDRVYEPLI